MVDKITSPVGANDVIKKINNVIDAIPTSTTQLTNDSGYITGITSSMVTSALGFTPYSNANPSGYQANVLETVKVNGTALTPSSKTVSLTVPTSTTQLTNDSGYITGITSSMVTSALGFTPYSNANPSGYQANVIETIKVNNTAQTVTSKTVSLTIPSEVTETTVSGWGFTKNAGTVTKVNNVSPDASGNVTIPTGGTVDQTFNASSTNAQSGTAIAGAGFITGITSTMVTSALGFTPYSNANPSGYQANVLETVKVNGTALTPSSKTVDVTVPTTTTAVTSGSTAVLTSGGAYSNLLRLSGAQTVSGNKTFSGTTTISGTIGLGSKATATTPTVTSNDTTVATTKFVKDQGYITGISSSDVTTALGYTPYSNANPNGYISSITSSMVTTALGFTPIASASVTTLTDATISSPTNGQALVYDSSTSKWKNASVSVNVSYDASTSTLYIG